MSFGISNLFDFADRIQMESLNQRQTRSELLHSNIANAETPGYRALGYDFEEQLQLISDANSPENMRISNPKHYLHPFATADATVKPDVFVVPTESIPQDGNTVDVDREMSLLAKNQILYRSAIETINRKIGLLKYAIQGGR